MEIATEQNEEIVSKLYEGVIGEIGKPGSPPDTEELAFVYEVEHFQQEIVAEHLLNNIFGGLIRQKLMG